MNFRQRAASIKDKVKEAVRRRGSELRTPSPGGGGGGGGSLSSASETPSSGHFATAIGFGSDAESAIEEKLMRERLGREKSTHDQLESLRWLISRPAEVATPGAPNGATDEGWAENFLPSVVKLLATKHAEIRRLACIFLVRHAEAKPDDALMAVNEVQKGLTNATNPHARAQAVRVLSSIRVRDITPITLVVVRGAAFDPHPVVRKAAVLALTKLYGFNRDLIDDLKEILQRVLQGEPTPTVLGAACVAYASLCQDDIALLHRPFRKLCKLAADMDEWSQISLLGLLHRYARENFIDPNAHANATRDAGSNGFGDRPPIGSSLSSGGAFNGALAAQSVDAFYSEDDDKAAVEAKAEAATEAEDAHAAPSKTEGPVVCDDHKLMIRCTGPLHQSRNAAVVMAVAALHFDFAPSYEHHRSAKALTFALRTSRTGCEHVLLSNILSLVERNPSTFSPFLTGYLVQSSDPLHVKCLKLSILTTMVTEQQLPSLLKELQAYLRDSNMEFVSQVICALGRCATHHEGVQDRILKSLISLSAHTSEVVSSHSVQVMLSLVQHRPHVYIAQIAKLVKKYKLLKSSVARLGILWMASCHLTLHKRRGVAFDAMREEVGEEAYNRSTALACEALRVATQSYIKEDEEVKIQILNSYAKLLVSGEDRVKPIFEYVIALAKNDSSYTLRDRARLYAGLLGMSEKSDDFPIIKELILSGGKLGTMPSAVSASSSYALGSLSHLVGHCAPGYMGLSEFAITNTSSSLRDHTWEQPAVSKAVRGPHGHGQSQGQGAAAGAPRASRTPDVSQSPLDNFYSDDDGGGSEDGSSYSYSEYYSDTEEAEGEKDEGEKAHEEEEGH